MIRDGDLQCVLLVEHSLGGMWMQLLLQKMLGLFSGHVLEEGYTMMCGVIGKYR